MNRERKRKLYRKRSFSRISSPVTCCFYYSTVYSLYTIYILSVSAHFSGKKETLTLLNLLKYRLCFPFDLFPLLLSCSLLTPQPYLLYLLFLVMFLFLLLPFMGSVPFLFFVLLNFFLFLNWFCLWLFYGSISFLILFFYSFSFLPYSVPFLVMMIRFFLVWFPFWLHSFSSYISCFVPCLIVLFSSSCFSCCVVPFLSQFLFTYSYIDIEYCILYYMIYRSYTLLLVRAESISIFYVLLYRYRVLYIVLYDILLIYSIAGQSGEHSYFSRTLIQI